jgi:hypothetical protein
MDKICKILNQGVRALRSLGEVLRVLRSFITEGGPDHLR